MMAQVVPLMQQSNRLTVQRSTGQSKSDLASETAENGQISRDGKAAIFLVIQR
jgi:hypothetical protein